ncbi:MAG: hypothetical protein JF606_19775 [Burkholderiales bacterium]|jgi:hypothetical protein|nr:hypothetical protein [Burkholderiales bacterium]
MDPTSGAMVPYSPPTPGLDMDGVHGSSVKAAGESLSAGKDAEMRAFADAIAKNWKAGADSVKNLSG